MATKIFLFGIDRAGKTSLSNTIKENKTSGETRPTIAFVISNMMIDDIDFQVWDAPGQRNFRKMWKNGFNKAQLLLFILDMSDKERFIEAKTELDSVLNDLETRGIPLVFCFHKIDVEGARANLNEARAVFKIPLIQERKVFLLETSINDMQSITQLKNTITSFIAASRN